MAAKSKAQEFLSTLSLRRATRLTNAQRTALVISIHALLAESDVVAYQAVRSVQWISIHALLAESDFCSRGERWGD